jgi:hypothetical protein
MGEANKRTLELVRNWCANLVVDKHGGGGLIEQLTALPVGPRSLSCPHAPASGFAGSDLKSIAVDFYERNCVGCAYRKPVGLPNLSSLVHERDKLRESAAREAARRDAAAVEAQRTRDAKRKSIRTYLTPPSANVIDQIGDLDHNRDGVETNRLVETAKLALDFFTAPVVEYAFELLEAGESWFDNAGLGLLKTLNVNNARLTHCALLCLARRSAAQPAAEILLESLALTDETMVGAAVPALIAMANPRHFAMAGPGQPPHPTPLIRLHTAFSKTVEASIAALFDGADPYGTSEAARGITALAAHDKTLPGRFARSLIGKFIRDRRLLQADEIYGGDGETLNELRMALALAYEASPVETEKLLADFLEGASEIGEARIFSIYREVLHKPQFDDAAKVTEAMRLALSRVVWHATETNSHKVLDEISKLLGGRPWGLTKLAGEVVGDLLGAAIVIDGKLASLSSAPLLDDPSGLMAMDRTSRRDVMRDLREHLIGWAAAGASQAPEGTSDYQNC